VAVVAVALTAGAWTAGQVVFGRSAPPPVATSARDRRAEGLLRDAADAARTVFMQRGTYDKITAAEVAGRAKNLRVAAAGAAARSGQVSIRPEGDDILILATPAANKTCFFARDEPTQSQIEFATARRKSCSAAAAPRGGWSSG
jgi:hypothetical protein